jgi:membrane associated rhomboid family serine protease
MLPIRDTVRSSSFPIVTWFFIALNGVVFLYEISLPPAELNALIMTFGLTPGQLVPTEPLRILQNPLLPLTFLTHMFMHGGWLHFLSNMWILFIFGDNVEDRMGSIRFLFYLISGLSAQLFKPIFIPTVLYQPSVPVVPSPVCGAYWVLFQKPRSSPSFRLFSALVYRNTCGFYLGFWLVTQIISELPVYQFRCNGKSRLGAHMGLRFWTALS